MAPRSLFVNSCPQMSEAACRRPEDAGHCDSWGWNAVAPQASLSISVCALHTISSRQLQVSDNFNPGGSSSVLESECPGKNAEFSWFFRLGGHAVSHLPYSVCQWGHKSLPSSREGNRRKVVLSLGGVLKHSYAYLKTASFLRNKLKG